MKRFNLTLFDLNKLSSAIFCHYHHLTHEFISSICDKKLQTLNELHDDDNKMLLLLKGNANGDSEANGPN
jgi:hypothetical protein